MVWAQLVLQLLAQHHKLQELLWIADYVINPPFLLSFNTKLIGLSVSPGHDATQLTGLAIYIYMY